jgi:hypothetical protein
MATPLAASLVDILLGYALAATGQEAGNRVSLDGLTMGANHDGALEIGIRKLEATSLRITSGAIVLDVGQLALHKVVALVRMQAGKPRLCALEVASAELSGVNVHGPVVVPQQAPADAQAAATQPVASSWSLGPLAAADGTVRARIVDAHLLFDADVTVPVHQGRIDFNQATVEHVGPDSRMGVSRLGLYVDAPNGRSYLYQFPSTPIAGVEYERRGALFGPWVTSRGNLQLQPFGEGVLRQPPAGPALGFTEQARLLFDRTAVSGDLKLGDGKFAAPGVQADLAGRADGHNVVHLQAEAVGRGLTLELASLLVRDALVSLGATQIGCDEVKGALALRLLADGGQRRFTFDLAHIELAGLRLELPRPESA